MHIEIKNGKRRLVLSEEFAGQLYLDLLTGDSDCYYFDKFYNKLEKWFRVEDK